MIDVLIAGAGPAGMVLALWLHRQAIRVKLIDKAPGPGTQARGFIIHARTLEFYHMLGIADEIIDAGRKFTTVNYWSGDQHTARTGVDDIGRGLSPFPFVLVLPQDEHERILSAHLARAGCPVGYGTELVSFGQGDVNVHALTRSVAGEKLIPVRFLCGCDGAHGVVRTQLGLGISGRSSGHFYIADAEGSGPAVNGELHAFSSPGGFNVVFPMRGTRRIRLVGRVPELAPNRRRPRIDVFLDQIASETKLRIDRVDQFTTFHVHHRVPGRFREGRVFLLGGHVHDAAGGPGINTGIGDAVNLAWKLAAVVKGQANPALLDSYEPERVASARVSVKNADRTLHFAGRSGVVPRLFRLKVLPAILPRLLRSRTAKRELFLRISHIGTTYRGTAFNQGTAGQLAAGDRLPWVDDDMAGNYSPLKALNWQIHVYGEATPELKAFCRNERFFLYEKQWTENYRAAGLHPDALYLVRPDGHIGYTAVVQDVAALQAFWKSLHGCNRPVSNDFLLPRYI